MQRNRLINYLPYLIILIAVLSLFSLNGTSGTSQLSYEQLKSTLKNEKITESVSIDTFKKAIAANIA